MLELTKLYLCMKYHIDVGTSTYYCVFLLPLLSLRTYWGQFLLVDAQRLGSGGGGGGCVSGRDICMYHSKRLCIHPTPLHHPPSFFSSSFGH